LAFLFGDWIRVLAKILEVQELLVVEFDSILEGIYILE